MQMQFWKVECPDILVTEDVILRRVIRCPALKTEMEAQLKSDVIEMEAQLKSDVTEMEAQLKSDVTEMEAQLKSDVDVVRGRTDKLWPYTAVSAVVMVLNSARQGPPSAIVNFHTKQSGMLLGLLQFIVNLPCMVSFDLVLL